MKAARVVAPLVVAVLVQGHLQGTAVTSHPHSISSPPNYQTLPPYQNRSDCTVQIPEAGLGWWYTHTYSYITASVQFQITEPSDGPANGASAYATGYTISDTARPANATQLLLEPLTLTQTAITTFSCSPLTTLTWIPTSTPTPVAPHTTSIVRSRYKSLATEETFSNRPGTAQFQLPSSYTLSLGPAATTLAEAPPSTTCTTVTAATPYLRFSNYEIISGSTTSTLDLASPIGYALPSKDYNGVLTASGVIPSDFASAIGQHATCKLATWSAQPTVVVIIEVIYAFSVALAAHVENSVTVPAAPYAHTEHTVSGLPPPPYYTSTIPQPTFEIDPTQHQESSMPTLQLPTGTIIVLAPTGVGITPPFGGDNGNDGGQSNEPPVSLPGPNRGLSPAPTQGESPLPSNPTSSDNSGTGTNGSNAGSDGSQSTDEPETSGGENDAGGASDSPPAPSGEPHQGPSDGTGSGAGDSGAAITKPTKQPATQSGGASPAANPTADSSSGPASSGNNGGDDGSAAGGQGTSQTGSASLSAPAPLLERVSVAVLAAVLAGSLA